MDDITLEEKKAAFKKLLEVGNLSALSEKERAQYECNLKSYRTYMSQLDYAQKKGMEKGREEGKTAKQLEMAKKMKSKGFSLDVISECSGLTLDQIEQL